MSRSVFGLRSTCCRMVCGLICLIIIFQIYSFVVLVRVRMENIKRNMVPDFHPLLRELVEPEELILLPPFGLKNAGKVDLFEEFLNESSLLKNIFFPDRKFFVDPIDPRNGLDNGSMYYYPGRVWLDIDGNPIRAHGGGILYNEISKTYYWYGEYKNGPTYRANRTGTARVDIIGVSCYSSKDLWTWKNEGIVLAGEEKNMSHDLYKLNVLERPKVIYNERTGKYVMWMHIDDATYTKASAGVAVSDSPIGPFKYLYSLRPNGFDSRDLTIFKEDNGVAYLIYSSIRNKELHISLLKEDYLDITNVMSKALVGQHREAPALFKHKGVYYMITSGCSGWTPNEALVHGAKSIMGPWDTIRNPCIGGNAVYRIATFFAQGTFVLPIPGGIPGTFIFVADRWNPNNLGNSRYVWLPLTVRSTDMWISGLPFKTRVSIFWHQKWRLPISPKEDL